MMFVPVEKRNVLTMMDRLIDCRLDVPITANRCATSASIARLKVGHDEYRHEPGIKYRCAVLRPTALLALTEGAHCWARSADFGSRLPNEDFRDENLFAQDRRPS
jgi:hypothetical protein